MEQAEVTLELNPEKILKRKEAAAYRLNVIQFPVLRVFGFFSCSPFLF